MYGFECGRKLSKGICSAKRCVYPDVCPLMKVDHQPQIDLLRKVRRIPGVKKVFVASGIRYDMLLCDKDHGDDYLREVVENHVSGQMKVARSTPKSLSCLDGQAGQRPVAGIQNPFR